MSTEQTRTSRKKRADGFSPEEQAAMQERAQELKAEARGGRRSGNAKGENDLLAKIAEMPEADRTMAERLHAIVNEVAPGLAPRTWYGMPAWAKGGKVLCFFQSADKFKTRYATLGFNEDAQLDDGTMWATSFALTAMTPENESTIAQLVKRAAS